MTFRILKEDEEEHRLQGNIFVGNLPAWLKKNEFAKYFTQFEPIKNVIFIKAYNQNGGNLGLGFFIYGGPEATSTNKSVDLMLSIFMARFWLLSLMMGGKARPDQ